MFSFLKIWINPLSIKKKDLGDVNVKETAKDTVIREMSTYTMPEITLDDIKNEVYCFSELEREKQALEKYRLTVDLDEFEIGETIFDSGE